MSNTTVNQLIKVSHSVLVFASQYMNVNLLILNHQQMFSLPFPSTNETTVCFGSCHEQSNNSPLRGRLLQRRLRPETVRSNGPLVGSMRLRQSFFLTPHRSRHGSVGRER